MHVIKNSQAPEVWYNFFCAASPLPRERSIITGELVSTGTSSLGMKYESDESYKHCRDVNDGNCEKFEDKPNDEIILTASPPDS